MIAELKKKGRKPIIRIATDLYNLKEKIVIELSFFDSDFRQVLAYCKENDYKPHFTEIKWRCLNTPQNWYYFFNAFPEGSKHKDFVYNNAKHFRLRSFQDAVAFLMIATEEDEKLAVNTVKKKLQAMRTKDKPSAVEIIQRSLKYAHKALSVGDMGK